MGKITISLEGDIYDHINNFCELSGTKKSEYINDLLRQSIKEKKLKYESDKVWIFEHCKLERVIDGDTIVAVVDLGFKVWTKVTLRLDRINAPEIRGNERPQGLESKFALEKMLKKENNKFQLFVSKKFGKFRWVGEIVTYDGVFLNDQLVKSGYAEYKEY